MTVKYVHKTPVWLKKEHAIALKATSLTELVNHVLPVTITVSPAMVRIIARAASMAIILAKMAPVKR